MKMSGKPPALRGRPRGFDAEKALDRALKVFWRKGYEGASLSDLTRAMGINRPSLYAAFGDKEELFRKALDRYTVGPAAYFSTALAEPTARAVAEMLLFGAAAQFADPRHPGCLFVQGALSCGESASSIRAELAARRMAGESALRRRFVRAVRDHDLPPGSNAADLARYIATVMHGMSVQAAGGAGRAELRRIARTALQAWPA